MGRLAGRIMGYETKEFLKLSFIISLQKQGKIKINTVYIRLRNRKTTSNTRERFLRKEKKGCKG